MMMNDKELADRIVALGVGSPLSADEFVRDWRVAGAMMEIAAAVVESIDIGTYEQGIVGARSRMPKFWCEIRELAFIRDDSLPRAINLACVEALQEKDDE